MPDPWRGRTPKPRIEWNAIKIRIDLAAVAVNLLGDPPGRGGARGLWWPCRFHQDANPSLTVDAERGRWKCYGCGEGGSAVDLVMRLEGATFPQAVERLAAMIGLDGGSGIEAPPRPRLALPKPKPKPPAVDAAEALARRQWAMRITMEAVERLWSPEGREALAYLRWRGLTDATIGAARLGFVASLNVPTKEGDRFIRAAGISFPWFDGDRLALLKVRRLDDRGPKYTEIFRERPTLYAPLGFWPGRPVVITEGEADCLLLGQGLRDVADVATLGSATGEPSREARRALLAAPRLFIATDGDTAGAKAARRLREHFPQAVRVRPPAPAKDWGELHAGGFGRIAYHWGRFLALGDPPRPEDFADASLYKQAPDERDRIEALEEREAIQNEPRLSDLELAAHLRAIGHRDKAAALEASIDHDNVDVIGPSLPQGGWEPERDDEAARLALLHGEPEASIPTQSNTQNTTASTHNNTHKTTGEAETELQALDRILSNIEGGTFLRVDPAELERFAEFDPPAVRSEPKPSEEPAASRPKRRRSARPSLFGMEV